MSNSNGLRYLPRELTVYRDTDGSAQVWIPPGVPAKQRRKFSVWGQPDAGQTLKILIKRTGEMKRDFLARCQAVARRWNRAIVPTGEANPAEVVS